MYTYVYVCLQTQAIGARYEPGKLVGRGADGCVLRCTNRETQAEWACKVIDVASLLQSRDGPNILNRLRNELSIMLYLAGHPNVVRLQVGVYIYVFFFVLSLWKHGALHIYD